MTDKETTEEPKSEEPERDSEAPKPPKAASRPLPAKVERALAAARAAAKADHERKSGRWLAIIPLSIGLVFLLFMLPRGTPPDGVPLPRVDHRVTRAIAEAEDRLADDAEAQRLPGDVLAIGSAIRDLTTAETEGNDPERLLARSRLDALLASLPKRPSTEQELVKLRASQTRTFLNALREWESGREPKDFAATGKSFVERAQEAGWTEERHLLLDETQRRVAFKTVWNAITRLGAGTFAITLDEERALYAFYIGHPRVTESHRLALEAKRRDATTPDACRRAQADWRRDLELWRADKIKRLAAIDPAYPAHYALGVTYFHAGRGELAVDAFNTYLEAHPEGPYALRARNHLKAALVGTAP